MSRQPRDPLRSLQDTERVSLVRLSRSASAPAAQVARARALLAVAEGVSYTAAAQLVGRHTGRTLHAAGFGWQKSRTWCETGVVVRKRKHGGLVRVTDPDAAAKRG